MSVQKPKYDNLPSLVKVWPLDDGDNDVEVDIIAVHGLGANPATTWVKNDICWLSDTKMLPAVVPNARIWTFNYESMWFLRRSTQDLESLGAQLRRFIRLKVPAVASRPRPIVFVAHSFGGLVVAQALTLPSSDDSGDQLLEVVKGIVFLGTPFRGSHVITHAKRIVLAARALRIDSSDALLDVVVPGSEELLDLTEIFSKMASDRNLNISCFYENLRTNVMKGPRALKMLGRRKPVHIVPKEMGRLEAHPSCGLEASHTDMNEYDDPKDGNYMLVSTEICKIVNAPQRTPRPKPLFLIPYMQNPEFVGREDVLNKIQRRMDFRPKYQTKLAIWGLGGIGKTQIATRHAYSIKDAYMKDGASIYFIRAATRERFSESYMKLASKAGIKLSTEPSEDKLRAVADWLEDGENGRWLMILDNADDIDLFKPGSGLIEYIPQCDHGSILITSRDKRVCNLLAGTNSSIFVDKLSQEDCRSLFQKHLPQEPLTDIVDELIDKLEYHPLALTQAVRVMSNNWIEPTRYLELHDESEPARVELLSEECQDINQEVSQQSIATTWAVSFDRIREKHSDAADMLAFMSFLDRQDIPRELLPRGEMTALKFDAALGTLQSYAMISQGSNGSGFNMHGLIQLSMRNWLRINQQEFEWLPAVMRALVEEFPDAERSHSWPLCRRYLPHILGVLFYLMETQSETKNRHITDGHLSQARDHDIEHEHSNSARNNFMVTKRHEVDLLLLMAKWCRIQGEPYEDDYAAVAFETAEEAFGKTDLHTLLARDEHMYSTRDRDWFAKDDSEPGLYSELLDTPRIIYGPDDPKYFKSVGNLAMMMSKVGRLDHAIQIRRAACERAEGLFGPDHLTTISSWNDLASELENFEKGYRWKGIETLEERLTLLQKTVKGYQKVIGEGESATLKAQHNLADAYSRAGKFSDAHKLLLEVIEGTQRLFGPDHRYTLFITSRLVVCHEAMGQKEVARKLNFEVLQKQTKVLGAGHSETIASRTVFERMNPGSIWRQQLMLKEGLELDEGNERLITMLEANSKWKGKSRQ